MVTRQKLADIAQIEALRFFHGKVMKTEPTVQPIISFFPWSIDEADGNWCAAFVYYCCIKAGFMIPIRPKVCQSSNLAGCFAWEEWSMDDKNISYYPAGKNDFTPEAGDIVLFDNVFIDHEHDHIGIVLANKNTSIIVAEGNINNVSGIIKRKKDSHIRAYIRIPDNYEYTEYKHFLQLNPKITARGVRLNELSGKAHPRPKRRDQDFPGDFRIGGPRHGTGRRGARKLFQGGLRGQRPAARVYRVPA